ncbi:hypothetical protein [Streptomyces sp. NPDC055400]
MDEDLDEDTKAYLVMAEGLSSEELDAELALLEAREALLAEEAADLAWQNRMFQGFSAAPPPPGLD